MYESIFDMIELRSFSSIWYWIAMAVAWSAAAHWTLGVPADLLRRAASDIGAQGELDGLASVTVPRRGGGPAPAPLEAGVVSAALTALAMLGFVYFVEFAQAVLLLLGPLALVSALDRRLARRILRDGTAGADLARRLRRARRRTQALAVVTIFLAALWGSWWTLATGPFGL